MFNVHTSFHLSVLAHQINLLSFIPIILLSLSVYLPYLPTYHHIRRRARRRDINQEITNEIHCKLRYAANPRTGRREEYYLGE
ncbi:hypothetical protein M430DRAFT_184870 [Amorphotheca resinae ATCC 22711]|uniref:Uncharacterized protein n=1 Tax=Amorphotheca resinae ATCC 22711 TaxID=857342 RepID=A0A2T3ASC6_AMORE|nr:hypothetical protein M430DRAFT_184870 [Amorphotheca resinae ATCC 22711]PSS09266.1 hypothetical protein M430DRAFT_184870 [Amorphotheca resinae ATCC 22711]